MEIEPDKPMSNLERRLTYLAVISFAVLALVGAYLALSGLGSGK